jgi:preprotein translocase subunit SecA
MRIFDKLLRAGEGKKQRALAGLVPDINALEDDMKRLSDDALRHKTVEFRERIDRALGDSKPADDELDLVSESGDDEDGYIDEVEAREARREKRQRAKQAEEREAQRVDDVLNDLLIEAFAVTREAARRVIGQRHYDVQMMGGAALHFGWIAEMKTGEGKTLVSTLPVYLNGLAQRGVHLITVNDYLAQRDAEWMGRVHRWLGLSLGIALPNMDFNAKKAAYACDVTYGTNTELGFDYLRDNMARSRDEMVQRGYNFGIIDEVDSILIDEARTPLIISGPASESARMYYQFSSIVRQLQRDVDYEVDEEKRTVVPTEEGIARVEQALNVENLYDVGAVSYVHQLTQALRAKELYHRDKEYIVADGEVKIVDEFTGRILDGRRWSDGLHQAVEAKERVKIQEENHTWATVTLQNYFRMYHKLAGMTGTAETEAAEFGNTYGMSVVPIPTHRGMLRLDEPDLIYRSESAKFGAIVEDLVQRNIDGQPVLVGTASVEKSELLSRLLKQRGVPHEVLNAKQHAREAEIVTQAGRIGAVTVATNMAGRGVDILLGGNPEGLASREVRAQGHELGSEEGQALYKQLLPKFQEQCKAEGDEVRELGGLYVLGTERHESRRIDNQLRGRSGRQGDPGESRFFLSLEDELMRLFATGAMAWIMERGLPDDVPIEAKMVTKAIERAQNTVESRNAEIRKDVLKYDQVMNEQRKVIYARRMQVIDGENLRDTTLDLLEGMIENAVEAATDDNVDEWDPRSLMTEIGQYYTVGVSLKELEQLQDAEDIIDLFVADARRFYAEKESGMPGGEETMRMLEREVMLRIIDQKWREHLAEMDYLREGINLRAMGQQDPLVAWQREGFALFGQLIAAIDDDYLRHITHVEVLSEETQAQDMSQAQFQAADDPVQRPAAIAQAQAPVATPVPQNREEPADDIYVQHQEPVVRSDHEKIGRNDPCYCGSGKKYKNCHGHGA